MESQTRTSRSRLTAPDGRFTREISAFLHGVGHAEGGAGEAATLFCSPARLIPGCVGSELVTLQQTEVRTVATLAEGERAAALREKLVPATASNAALRHVHPVGGADWSAYEQELQRGGLCLDGSLPLFQDGDFAVRLLVYSAAAGPSARADDSWVERAQLVADLVANRIAARAYRDVVGHLQAALSSNRRIGAAMGILMARHALTDAEAFELLKQASQRRHVKLRDVAEDILLMGDIP